MKKLKSTISNVILIAFTISSIISCSGEDGKDGIDGTNGETGTANVIYSNWINQNWNNINGDIIKSMMIMEPRITSEILNNGFVLGFFRFSDQTVIYNLPFSNNGPGVNITRSYLLNLGSISFFAQRYNTSIPMNELNLNGSATSIPQVRYVIVPGGANIAGRLAARPDYSKMSYQEICTMFNIPE